jgi:hypothetical protein
LIRFFLVRLRVGYRLRVLDMPASERLLAAGMHLDSIPFGHAKKQGEAYAFIPLDWSSVR